MTRAYSKFLKNERLRQRLLCTNTLLDRAFKVPLQGSLLIRGEPYSGITAICIELAKSAIDSGHEVFYVDICNQVLKHRINDLNKDHLNIILPTDPKQILNAVQMFKGLFWKPIYILDSVGYIKEEQSLGWNLKTDLGRMAYSIRRCDPEATVICSQRGGFYNQELWDSVANIKLVGKDHVENELVGHYSELIGNEGKAVIYIEYKTGRLSLAYEQIVNEIESGKSPNGIFSSPDGEIEVKGYKNYLHIMNNRINIDE